MSFVYGFIIGIVASVVGLILIYNNNKEKVVKILDWFADKF